MESIKLSDFMQGKKAKAQNRSELIRDAVYKIIIAGLVIEAMDMALHLFIGVNNPFK